MTRQDIVGRVNDRLGQANPVPPAKIIKAVAATISAALSHEGARSLAEELPEEMAPAPSGSHNVPLLSEDLYARVSEELEVELSHAAEYVVVAAQVIAQVVGPVLAERLRRDLPAPIARLLHPPEVLGSPAPHLDRAAHTVAESAPSHGLYAARPTTTQSSSVNAEANPHSDIKLSTATGTTQERTGRTIASGSPLKK
jgi:uncharacterized protein (DUF2267 family)